MGGTFFLCDTQMTRWWRIEPSFWHNKESGLREGMCVICVARVCASACHTDVSYPPFRSPPLRSARKYFLFAYLPLDKLWTVNVLAACGTPCCARSRQLHSISLETRTSQSFTWPPAEARRWIFLRFFAGKFGKLSGKFGGNFAGFFLLTHKTKAQNFRGGKISEYFS